MNISSNHDYDPHKVHYFLQEWELNMDTKYLTSVGNGLAKLPPASVLLYLLLVYYGPKLMKDRKPMNVKWLLFAWNSLLSLFSAGCVIRMGAFLVYELDHMSLQEKICNSTLDNPSGLWSFMFILSKLFELGDTVFLIIRKKPVIFLHWYHHTTVLLFTWFAGMQEAPYAIIFAFVNVAIHTIMYAYFACRTIGIRFPKYVSISLTLSQIVQMVIGLVVLYLRYDAVYNKNLSCMTSQDIFFSGVIMYASYFALFVNFFIHSYFLKGWWDSVKLTDENANFKIE
jgi:hypothetical protein